VASVRLTDAESWELLERSRVGVFTSLKQDGTPISLPVWFAPLEGRIYLHGPSNSKKFTRVRNNPRVSFVCESGERWVELTAVHLTGQARVLSDDYALEESVAAAFDRRYTGLRVEPTAIPQAARDNYRQFSVIEIVPDARILSWDNSRLGLDRP
jgi:nitroimidazol reductase NimA-like FMN-containing flavoprotein (pyridoxamine 5'-phosphate oxidase superfamily)